MTADLSTTPAETGASSATLSLMVQYDLRGTQNLTALERALRAVAQRAIEDGTLEGYGAESIEDYQIDAQVDFDDEDDNVANGKLHFRVFYSSDDGEESDALERALLQTVEDAVEKGDLIGFESESILDYNYSVEVSPSVDSEPPITRPRVN